VLEVPELIPGLKAWFDSRDAAYFALGGGGEVSAWLSRAGSLAGIAWTQGTASNQPIRIASEPLFNNLPAVSFDGVNDWLLTNNQNAWAFKHNGAGFSSFRVLRADGATPQTIFANALNLAEVGMFDQYTTTASAQRICNGSGIALVSWSLATAAYFSRGVTRWHMWGHVTGTSHQRISGNSATLPDTAGTPSAANPSFPARLGITVTTVQPLQGYIAQDLYYDHVLTAGETTQLADWSASLYGVAA
jgi:hypothetical protein